jgi:GNAT superfamily N-acetyltransferase
MVRLAEEFFGTKGDPDQLSVDETVLDRLRRLHPSTIGEETSENGPVAWTIIIPTSELAMRQFLSCECNERELLESCTADTLFESIYLCSALVLPEYRGKGVAKRLLLRSIEDICAMHPVRSLYCWTFSAGGRRLAQSIAHSTGLPLFERSHY